MGKLLERGVRFNVQDGNTMLLLAQGTGPMVACLGH